MACCVLCVKCMYMYIVCAHMPMYAPSKPPRVCDPNTTDILGARTVQAEDDLQG